MFSPQMCSRCVSLCCSQVCSQILSQIFSYKNKISNGGGHSILSITLGNKNGIVPSNSNFGDDMIEKIAARERALHLNKLKEKKGC